MSYWGAMIIVDLVDSIPYVGYTLSDWLWCSKYDVILRIFTFHFLLGVAILLLVVLHIILLHAQSSSNVVSFSRTTDLVPFYIFLFKDMYYAMFLVVFLSLGFLVNPMVFGELDNNNQINIYNTPEHIRPIKSVMFVYIIVRMLDDNFMALLLIACLFYLISSFGCDLYARGSFYKTLGAGLFYIATFEPLFLYRLFYSYSPTSFETCRHLRCWFSFYTTIL